MPTFNVVVAGIPYGCQDARPDGTWLTEAQFGRIMAVSDDIVVHHPPAHALNSGRAPLPDPDAILVETSGAEPSWESLPGVVFGAPLHRLITPRLRFLQSASAGVEHLLPLVSAGTPLCNASGVHANAIAETVLAVMLSRAKMLPVRRDDQLARAWRQLPCQELSGSTMCVIGTGHIGTEVARLAKAFGIRTTGVRRKPGPSPYFDQVLEAGRVQAALSDAHFAVVACPLTEATRGLVSAKELAGLPRGAFLINVSRGAIIDEEALIDALGSGHLGGAFLDTHVREPLPPNHPLWNMEGVYITPHDSHASQLMGDRHVALFCDNLARCLAGEPLVNVVDPALGY